MRGSLQMEPCHAESRRRNPGSGLAGGPGSRLQCRRQAFPAATRHSGPRIWRSPLEIVRTSSLYLTEPVDYPGQPWFLNQALLIRTTLPPDLLLACCLNVEKAQGRQRRLPKGPRTIDVDILLYADQILSERKLTIPAPPVPPQKVRPDGGGRSRRRVEAPASRPVAGRFAGALPGPGPGCPGGMNLLG